VTELSIDNAHSSHDWQGAPEAAAVATLEEFISVAILGKLKSMPPCRLIQIAAENDPEIRCCSIQTVNVAKDDLCSCSR